MGGGGGGGVTGAFFPRPQPKRGPLNTCLKDLYTLIEQSGSRYSNRAVTVFFKGAVSQVIIKEIWEAIVIVSM